METTKTCRDCGRTLPITEFSATLKSKDGHQPICRECMSKRIKASRETADREKKPKNRNKVTICPEPKAVNPELAKFKARELLEELRMRGYRGTLEYTYTITL